MMEILIVVAIIGLFTGILAISVPSFLDTNNTNPKKIYCIDHALVRSVSSGVLVNDGHLLENIIFLALRRKHAKVFYYKSKNGREVDFAIRGNKGVELTQVCDSLTHPATREREIKSLTEAMMETGSKTAIIVTRSEEGMEQTQAGTILIQPAWHWLLEYENHGHVKIK
jgi:predicted AAA+ superfamily ATPase